MITREEIVAALKDKGYDVKAASIQKNGEDRNGIVLKMNGTDVGPFIHTDRIVPGLARLGATPERIVEMIEGSIKRLMEDTLLSTGGILDRKNVMDHIRIILQRAADNDAAKRDCGMEGVESCLCYYEHEENGFITFLVTEKYLKALEIDPEEAWKRAEENTFTDTVITQYEDMMRKLRDLHGIDLTEEEMCTDLELFIVSNSRRFKGAAAILNRSALRELSEQTNVYRWIVIPSSIHECMIIPDKYGNRDGLDDFIKDVNAAAVHNDEILADRAFFIEL